MYQKGPRADPDEPHPHNYNFNHTQHKFILYTLTCWQNDCRSQLALYLAFQTYAMMTMHC